MFRLASIAAFVFTLVVPHLAAANPPYVLNAQSWGNPQNVSAASMAFTTGGDIAITGTFEGTLIFAGVDTLVSVDKEDVFVAVLSPDGTAQWAISFGGVSHQLAVDIDVDSQNNIVVGGNVFEQADLGGGVMTSPNLFNPFVVVYDAGGNYLWGALPDFDFASAVAFAQNGDVLVTGDKSGFVGPPQPLGSQDIYLARYTSAGNLVFETRLGGAGFDNGGDVVGLPNGDCVVAASAKLNWPTSSFSDAVLARYDSAGNQLWSTSWGGSLDEDVSSLAVGPDGSLYFGGDFNSSDAPLLSAPWRGLRDWFVAKADSNGVVQWVRNGGWPGVDRVVDLDVALSGDVAVTGSIRGSFTDGDLFLAHFDALGNEVFQAAFPSAGGGDDQGRSILLDTNLDMIVAGMFQGVLDLSWFELQSQGQQDAFFVRVQSSPAVTAAPPATRVTLEQNSPNPFNPRTIIRYSLTESAEIALEIYDARGRRVRTLHEGRQVAGEHSVVWDGRDDAGHDLASGVYRYRLAGTPMSEDRKMVLLR